jgi:peptide/nickel transport system substrate-binding protein
MNEHGELRSTRRQVLGQAAAGGVALSAGGLLAACGSGSSSSSSGSPATSSGTPEGPKRMGGVLKVGTQGGSAADTIDAHLSGGSPADSRIMQLYDTLTWRKPDFSIENRLAEELTPNRTADVWTIRLRPDVEFHNGKSLTADDLIFSFRRILDPKLGSVPAATLSSMDANRMKKLDDRTVRLTLKAPNAILPEELSFYHCGIVPEDYDPKNPVGTGPFKYESLDPATFECVLSKNENYWESGLPYVDEVVIKGFNDDTARINALISGQVHAISHVPFSQLKVVEANPKLGHIQQATGLTYPFAMRSDAAPFNDVRLRQAMKLIADRKQLVGQALSGFGTVANDIWGRWDPQYNKDLPQREQDLEQAKSLLKAAGQSDLRVTLTVAEIAPGTVAAATVLQQQAKAAGVAIKVNKVDPGTFYGPSYGKYPLSIDWWSARGIIQQAFISQVPDAPYNFSHWNDSQFISLMEKARGTLDEAKQTEYVHEAQKIQYERSGDLIWTWADYVDVYSKQITGVTESRLGYPLNTYNLKSFSFVS